MSRFLINEPPLLVSKTLSCIIGLNEALVLQQIHYYQEISKNIYDQKRWVYNSVANWKKEHFPFWSEATIKRALNSLESKGLLFSANYNKDPRDQTKWYSVDYDVVSKLESEYMTNAFGQNDQMESSKMTQCNESDCTNALVHNDQMHGSNMTQPLPKTTTEITTKNKTLCQVHAEPDHALCVLNHFNEITGFNYQNKKTTMGYINDRLAEGYTASELNQVADYLTAKWLKDKDMVQSLRPMTVFSEEKFEGYLQCSAKWHEEGRPVCINKKWVKRGEIVVDIDVNARDEAFVRIVSSRGTPQDRIEEIASELAGRRGIRTAKEFQARQTWISIWKQATEQAAQEATA